MFLNYFPLPSLKIFSLLYLGSRSRVAVNSAETEFKSSPTRLASIYNELVQDITRDTLSVIHCLQASLQALVLSILQVAFVEVMIRVELQKTSYD